MIASILMFVMNGGGEAETKYEQRPCSSQAMHRMSPETACERDGSVQKRGTQWLYRTPEINSQVVVVTLALPGSALEPPCERNA